MSNTEPLPPCKEANEYCGTHAHTHTHIICVCVLALVVVFVFVFLFVLAEAALAHGLVALLHKAALYHHLADTTLEMARMPISVMPDEREKEKKNKKKKKKRSYQSILTLKDISFPAETIGMLSLCLRA